MMKHTMMILMNKGVERERDQLKMYVEDFKETRIHLVFISENRNFFFKVYYYELLMY